MIFLLLVISLVFWKQDLNSEPLENKPVAYLDESLDNVDSEDIFPGPEDTVVVDRAPELIEAP
ncbi:MAG: hypothetical protein GWO41_01170, partial [candidate division Zixibacteria bacterium]|nr:hypothetical protein [candidate division Zixibacteria bacterium]NIR65229.1 hypothetical protein [candidate division Zixibacteria bacterium]NIS14865.1 hypothetical protein [candidate division Zixibacteria bacterium]NIS46965.1 hypothetical protein [candidate division Zixibacteria bacterium]NIT51387.1 hypothetical protein [candidate division Zixibacteria bacterium]